MLHKIEDLSSNPPSFMEKARQAWPHIPVTPALGWENGDKVELESLLASQSCLNSEVWF